MKWPPMEPCSTVVNTSMCLPSLILVMIGLPVEKHFKWDRGANFFASSSFCAWNKQLGLQALAGDTAYLHSKKSFTC